jgi:hypothetical protein
MKNINRLALSLAHEIKTAYSTFRLALIAAYALLKSGAARQQYLIAYTKACMLIDCLTTIPASLAIKRLGLDKAFTAVWNLAYLN